MIFVRSYTLILFVSHGIWMRKITSDKLGLTQAIDRWGNMISIRREKFLDSICYLQYEFSDFYQLIWILFSGWKNFSNRVFKDLHRVTHLQNNRLGLSVEIFEFILRRLNECIEFLQARKERRRLFCTRSKEKYIHVIRRLHKSEKIIGDVRNFANFKICQTWVHIDYIRNTSKPRKI